MSSGYTTRLPDDVLLDTGVLYVGNNIWGATRGGITWEPGSEWRHIGYDGEKAPRIGLDRKAYVAAKFSGRFIHFCPEDIAKFEPGSTTVGSDPSSLVISPQPAGQLLAEGEYLSHVRLVFDRGQGGYCQIRMPKAFCAQYQVQGNDRAEGEVQVTIEARIPEAETEGHPGYVIEMVTALS